MLLALPRAQRWGWGAPGVGVSWPWLWFAVPQLCHLSLTQEAVLWHQALMWCGWKIILPNAGT